MALTVADLLVQRLQQHGVRHIFGYPGGQLTPIYDALYRQSDIRHVLARDEQAAAFMADGYARATGKPGVCLAVCGPGVYNAATALATSFTDSIPVLLISGQVPSGGQGLRSGYYHENDQRAACATLTKGSFRVVYRQSLLRELDQALALVRNGRPGPVLFEAPIDVLRAEGEVAGVLPLPPHFWSNPTPEHFRAPTVEQQKEIVSRLDTNFEQLAGWVSALQRPLLLAGGGVISARAEGRLLQLAEHLGAPIIHTLMGKCAVPADHPLAAGLVWHRATSDVADMADCFSPLFAQSDGVLAVGCRFSQASTGSWQLPLPRLAQIDIDRAELGRHYPIQAGVIADAGEALECLLGMLPRERRAPWAGPPVPRPPWRLPGLDLVGPLRNILPRDAVVVADITRLGYILMAEFPAYAPRSVLHPAGFVPMGYGIPAALGVKAAYPDRVVVAVEGDGCFQMCGMELATAVQEKLPIVVVLVNDSCLSLIKSTQERRYEKRFIGVDLVNPDFQQFARAFGVRSWRVASDAAFDSALREAIASKEAAVIEVRVENR